MTLERLREEGRLSAGGEEAAVVVASACFDLLSGTSSKLAGGEDTALLPECEAAVVLAILSCRLRFEAMRCDAQRTIAREPAALCSVHHCYQRSRDSTEGGREGTTVAHSGAQPHSTANTSGRQRSSSSEPISSICSSFVLPLLETSDCVKSAETTRPNLLVPL